MRLALENRLNNVIDDFVHRDVAIRDDWKFKVFKINLEFPCIVLKQPEIETKDWHLLLIFSYDERRLQFAFVLGGLADPGLMLEFITMQGVCVDVMSGRGQICRGRVGNRAGAGLDHGVGIQQGMR